MEALNRAPMMPRDSYMSDRGCGGIVGVYQDIQKHITATYSHIEVPHVRESHNPHMQGCRV